MGTSGGPQETCTASEMMASFFCLFVFFKIQRENSLPEVSPVCAEAIRPVWREGNKDTWESVDLLLAINQASTAMQGRPMTP